MNHNVVIQCCFTHPLCSPELAEPSNYCSAISQNFYVILIQIVQTETEKDYALDDHD